jgi:para-aminobenzoate synthetase/4-amino-4-deoxychorismate lyase
VYTGSLGWAGPEGTACFNVAIRTALVDREARRVRFGVGSGLVADSQAQAEHAECLLKARILEERPFELLETLRCDPGQGHRRLEGHLQRLAQSARHFGFAFDAERARRTLDDAARPLTVPSRVRLLLDYAGRFRCETAPLTHPPARLRVALAERAVDRNSIWLHHKTTRREIYAAAAERRPDCDDVLLWNLAGELTEATRFNVVVERRGEAVTPPLSSGLLAGVERAALLSEGSVREAVVLRS